MIFPRRCTPSSSHPRAPSEPFKRTGLLHKTPKTVTWAADSTGEEVKQEEEKGNQEALQQKRLMMLEKAGVKVLPAAVCYGRSERRSMRAAAAVVGQFLVVFPNGSFRW